MFATLWSALQHRPSRQPRRSPVLHRKPTLEALEDRNLLSGGPGGGPGPSGGSGTPVVAVLSTSVSNGSGGGLGISGPGYPLAPATGPARPDPATLSQPSTTTVLVPLSGTPGGPGPTVAVVPVCSGSGTSGGPGTAG
jgi:hypothetical protein